MDIDIEDLRARLLKYLQDQNGHDDTSPLWIARHSPLSDDNNAELTELVWDLLQQDVILEERGASDRRERDAGRDGFRIDERDANFAVAFGEHVRNLLLFSKDPWKIIENFARKVRSDGEEDAIESGRRRDIACDAAVLLLSYLGNKGELPAGQKMLAEYATEWGQPEKRQATISRGLARVGKVIGMDLNALIDGRYRSGNG